MILLMNSEGSDQTVQADLGLCCRHMLEDMFSHGMAHLTSLYMSVNIKCSTVNHLISAVSKFVDLIGTACSHIIILMCLYFEMGVTLYREFRITRAQF